MHPGRIFETHCKSNIVLVSFGITTSGWWAWNVFLSAAYNPEPAPYGVKNGFLHQFGLDCIWWLTLILHVSVLVVAYVTFKVGRKYLPHSKAFALLIPQRANRRTDDCEVDIEYWQELEQDPLVREKLASLAKHGMGQSF
jgi:phospholipid-translocating ATPase